ncbi:MAG: hypothetical protein ACOWW1_05145 [archaeon]|jgi:hypothetical protein|nr:hypothetical protein [Candidatus Bathyarchaeum sp.]
MKAQLNKLGPRQKSIVINTKDASQSSPESGKWKLSAVQKSEYFRTLDFLDW